MYIAVIVEGYGTKKDVETQYREEGEYQTLLYHILLFLSTIVFIIYQTNSQLQL